MPGSTNTVSGARDGMGSSIAQSQKPVISVDRRMAKADLRKAERDPWREEIGQAIERVKERSGLSLKEFAEAVQRDERQVGRWFDGTEHPQIAAIFAVALLRPLLIVVLAELAGADVDIETVVRIRRERSA